MQIKVFHPYFKSSIFCKEMLNKYNNYDIKVYSDNDFSKQKEIEEIKSYNEFIFIAPLWWYTLPHNFIKWCELLKDQKNLFKNKKIKFIIMTGGNQKRYPENSKVSIKNMNMWIEHFFKLVEWELYYDCIPENIDSLRAVWFKKWNFEKVCDNND